MKTKGGGIDIPPDLTSTLEADAKVPAIWPRLGMGWPRTLAPWYFQSP
jgi:hypothetical protein